MIRINGIEYDLDGISVERFLETKGYRKEAVAVEINEEIIPKASYCNVFLKNNDIIEIINFVGGG